MRKIRAELLDSLNKTSADKDLSVTEDQITSKQSLLHPFTRVKPFQLL